MIKRQEAWRRILKVVIVAFSLVTLSQITDAQTLTVNQTSFQFGAACNGTDCVSGEYHVVVGTNTLPNVAGLCLLAGFVSNNNSVNLVDVYNEWYQWNGTTFAVMARPSSAISCPSSYSSDKTIVAAPSGSIVNATGTWTWGGSCGYGIHAIDLNGSSSSACGSKLTMDHDGIIYALNRTWWQYNPSSKNWTNLGVTTAP